MLAVLRIRGRVGVRKDIEETMCMLGLNKKHALAIVNSSPSTTGMIKKSEDFVTWGEISEGTIELLKDKKGERKVYNLAPPRRGFKSLKKRYPKGDLGYRGNEINPLIERMI